MSAGFPVFKISGGMPSAPGAFLFAKALVEFFYCWKHVKLLHDRHVGDRVKRSPRHLVLGRIKLEVVFYPAVELLGRIRDCFASLCAWHEFGLTNKSAEGNVVLEGFKQPWTSNIVYACSCRRMVEYYSSFLQQKMVVWSPWRFCMKGNLPGFMEI